MLLRIVISCFSLIIFVYANSSAQIMHIHTGVEEREFNLSDVDSIKFVDLEVWLSVTPRGRIRFGPVIIGDFRELILTLGNTGNGALRVSGVEIEEEVFEANFEDPIEIAPGQSSQLIVGFYPQEVRNYSTQLIIRSNSHHNSDIIKRLSGSGHCAFVWEETRNYMVIYVSNATINNEPLVEFDEIGVFTTDGLCAGGGLVPAGFPEEPLYVGAYRADRGMDNGFQFDERLNFRIWDASTEIEYRAGCVVENDEQAVYNESFLSLRVYAILE